MKGRRNRVEDIKESLGREKHGSTLNKRFKKLWNYRRRKLKQYFVDQFSKGVKLDEILKSLGMKSNNWHYFVNKYMSDDDKVLLDRARKYHTIYKREQKLREIRRKV